MWKDSATSLERFEGEYKLGKRDGEGYYVFQDGSRYIGTFKNDLRHGQGNEIDKLGNSYQGMWVEDVKEDTGDAIHIVVDGPVKGRYVGQFSDGKRNGYGIETLDNGDTYKGQWKDGAKHEEGIAFNFYANGDRYEGSYING